MSLKISQNVNLAEYTSWLVGGNADNFCLPKTLDDLKEAISFAKDKNLKITILGGGTNVLVSDDGIEGLTICLRRLSKISSFEKDGRLHIEALSGTAKSELLKTFLKQKLAPALFLAGLPGDVGGGVVMNAGVAEAFVPREFMDFVDWVEVLTLDLQTIRLQKNQLNVKYRHTDGWQPHIIVNVGMSWPLENDPTILDKVRETNKIRLSKQPLDMPSCGSVFKNPEGHKAAQLIDSTGLKGYRVGDAQVSLKHANFIVNLEKATAKNIWDVITHVQKTVEKEKGVKLTTEVVKLGRW
ncbi:UDP-N-acetylmuramate dehydrogenase [Pseudobdellovibrio sp. HCB154]|uniref:UDP-N-acetylmuramate dehydrogenase n=1 Tax=Pseudobdellovibrio sp. HCB154 TaxID=3386277 RepID=UPI003916D3BD